MRPSCFCLLERNDVKKVALVEDETLDMPIQNKRSLAVQWSLVSEFFFADQ